MEPVRCIDEELIVVSFDVPCSESPDEFWLDGMGDKLLKVES